MGPATCRRCASRSPYSGRRSCRGVSWRSASESPTSGTTAAMPLRWVCSFRFFSTIRFTKPYPCLAKSCPGDQGGKGLSVQHYPPPPFVCKETSTNRAGVAEPQTCKQEYASVFALPLLENDGNSISRSVLLVSKNVRKQSPFKI